MLAPISTLDEAAAEKTDICVKQHLLHAEALYDRPDLKEKLIQVFSSPGNKGEHSIDIDASLYTGGFFSAADREKIKMISETEENRMMQITATFDDPRLDQMLFRYQCRNYPHLLHGEQKKQWNEYRKQRIRDNEQNDKPAVSYANKIKQLLQQYNDPHLHQRERIILSQLQKYPQLIGITDVE